MSGFTSHGGRLLLATRTWPEAPAPWIDLSTGINPWAYAAPRASRAARGRLPFPEETAALEAVAAASFGIDDPERVVAVPGAEAAIRLLPQTLGADAVFVPGPTYASHADAWTRAGAQLVDREPDATVSVLVNPNNPDGRFVGPDELITQADRVAARDGWLVVDESFAETLPGPSIAAAGHPRIVALRSFGKFFGLAGLRLGFLASEPELMRDIRARQGNWPVSADALAAGVAAYADGAWIARTRLRLVRDAERLDAALLGAGFEIVGGTSLFRLARAADASRRFEALCAHGILTRPFADEPTWLRFGLPHPSGQRRVEDALRTLA